MSTLTNYQIIEKDGKPAFAVIPYDEFLKLIRDEERTIPHEVVGLVVKKGMNLVKAWRTYLGMTQAEVAKKAVSPRPPSLRWKRPIMNYVPLRLKS